MATLVVPHRTGLIHWQHADVTAVMGDRTGLPFVSPSIMDDETMERFRAAMAGSEWLTLSAPWGRSMLLWGRGGWLVTMHFSEDAAEALARLRDVRLAEMFEGTSASSAGRWTT